MKSEYLNKTGGGAGAAAGAAAGGAGGINPDIIGSAIAAFGQIGVSVADAAKRRQMEYAMGQQRLQAELGLADRAAKQAADTARLSILAQAATGKPAKDEDKPNTALIVGVSLGAFALVGTLIYFAVKK